jgi:hypothetical protein
LRPVRPLRFRLPARVGSPGPTPAHRVGSSVRSPAAPRQRRSPLVRTALKLKAGLFDNKIESLGFSAVFAARTQGLSLLDFIHLDYLTDTAAFDAGLVIWGLKREYEAVSPLSATGPAQWRSVGLSC